MGPTSKIGNRRSREHVTGAMRGKKPIAGLLVAVLAALPLLVWATQPKQRIDQVIAHAEKQGIRQIVGVDFVSQDGATAIWDVYMVRNGKVWEVQFRDSDLKELRREKQKTKVRSSGITIRQALASVHKAVPGTVTSLELERDSEHGWVWSAVVLNTGSKTEAYLSPKNGNVLEVETVSTQRN